MISLKQGKKILFENLNSWFEFQGYYFKDIEDGYYIKDIENWKFAIKFNFFDKTDDHFNSTILMHSKHVEKIILEAGMPNINLEKYRNGQYIFFTLQDKVNLNSFMLHMNKINLSTQEGYEKWAKLIISYMSSNASDFVTQFRYLPNVLAAIENIESQGHNNYLELLVGGIDHLFRALIISKLCDDKNYETRKRKFDDLILKPKYILWHPHYEKLKDILENNSPIYGLDINSNS